MARMIGRGIVCLVLVGVLLITLDVIIQREEREEAYHKEEKELSSEVYEGVEFEIPVIVVDTKEKMIEEDIYTQATWAIYDQKTTYFNLTEPSFKGGLGIKIRGNTTRAFPKKQFKVQLQDETLQTYNEPLLGMPKESDWVLNGPFKDKSLMRNYIAYEVVGAFRPETPEVKFCEVFITKDSTQPLTQAHYQGVYILLENIKQDEERVAIQKTTQQDETSFLVARNPLREGDKEAKTLGKETYRSDYPLQIVYPNDATLTQGKIDYIEATINAFEWSLYRDDFKDPEKGYIQHIDVASFVDYVVINEYFNNGDAGVLSTYMYQDYTGKLYVGPIWDFNSAMGNQYVIGQDYGEFRGFHMQNKVWFDRLLQDEAFVAKVIARYKELRMTYLSDEVVLGKVDEALEILGDAVVRNEAVWPFEMANQERAFKNNGWIFKAIEHERDAIMPYFYEHLELQVPTDMYTQTYEEEIAQLKQFIKDRGAWLDTNIDLLDIGVTSGIEEEVSR